MTIFEAFEKWLDKNIHRFNHWPIKVEERLYRFEGVQPCIVLFPQESVTEICIAIENQKEDECCVFDYLICEYEDENVTLHEAFENLLTFCNEHFNEKNFLWLIECTGANFAYIEEHLPERVYKGAKLQKLPVLVK